MNICQHPAPDDQCLDHNEDGPICGRPAVDKLVYSDGSATHLCAFHIDEWIDDIRVDAEFGMTVGIREEAQADLERNGL